MLSSFCGTWDQISSVNMEGYMIALGISLYVRKIVMRIKMKKVIEQQGDQYVIKTCSFFRNYTFSFTVDQWFEEFTQGVDNRHVKSLVTWDGKKLVCEQIGEKKNRGWTHWIEDDKLYLEMFADLESDPRGFLSGDSGLVGLGAHELYCEGEVCRQIFKKNVNE